MASGDDVCIRSDVTRRPEDIWQQGDTGSSKVDEGHRVVSSAHSRRRQFGSDGRYVWKVYESINEAAADTDSLRLPPIAGTSTFSRYLRYRHVGSCSVAARDGHFGVPARHGRRRDFSVDERTDAVFNEFVRFDPTYEDQSRQRLSTAAVCWRRTRRRSRSVNEVVVTSRSASSRSQRCRTRGCASSYADAAIDVESEQAAASVTAADVSAAERDGEDSS